MKSPIFHPLIILCLTLLLGSCDEGYKIDETAPQIRVMSPFETAEYRSDEKLFVQLELTDDVDLKEFTLRVHDDSRPHSETSPPSFFEWDTLIHMNVFGTKTDLKFELPLPQNFTPDSDYHFVAMCVDKSGNQTKWMEIPFKVVSPFDNEIPVITLRSSSPVGTFPNDPFVVMADIYDNLLIKEIRVTLTDGLDVIYSDNVIKASQIGGNFFSLQEFLTAPSISGNYTVRIIATDGLDNVSSLEVPVKVL